MSGFGTENYKDPFQHLFLFLILMLIGLIGLLIWVSYDDSITSYKMPNGIICESDMTTGGGFGGATHEFFNCSDGKRYINPETYRQVYNG